LKKGSVNVEDGGVKSMKVEEKFWEAEQEIE
jgi:hypothetical protein